MSTRHSNDWKYFKFSKRFILHSVKSNLVIVSTSLSFAILSGIDLIEQVSK